MVTTVEHRIVAMLIKPHHVLIIKTLLNNQCSCIPPYEMHFVKGDQVSVHPAEPVFSESEFEILFDQLSSLELSVLANLKSWP